MSSPRRRLLISVLEIGSQFLYVRTNLWSGIHSPSSDRLGLSIGHRRDLLFYGQWITVDLPHPVESAAFWDRFPLTMAYFSVWLGVTLSVTAKTLGLKARGFMSYLDFLFHLLSPLLSL